MNNVTLIGRLTKDPEMRYLQSGVEKTTIKQTVDKQISKDKKEEFEQAGKPTERVI